MKIITAKQAREKTDKYLEEKVLKDKFCEYINNVIETACNNGEYECMVEESDMIKNQGVHFYKDILTNMGYSVEEKCSILQDPCYPMTQKYIIKW